MLVKIYNDDVAGIITALQKKGTETVQLHVRCHTEYIHKKEYISKSNRPFSKVKRLRSTVSDFVFKQNRMFCRGKCRYMLKVKWVKI